MASFFLSTSSARMLTRLPKVVSYTNAYPKPLMRSFIFRSLENRNLIRYMSSRKKNNKGRFKLDALPFSISPEEALEKFQSWAHNEQGLYYLLQWNNVRIGAAYVPVWSFDVNIRFVITDRSTGKKQYGWKPSIFSVYQQQSVIHLPGLASYAGYSYRRSLINPIVNTTLLFMGDQTVPFGNWMLRDMKLSNGETLEVAPDPWNSTRGQNFRYVFEELEDLAAQEAEGDVKVQSQIVSSRRVYLPMYFIDYSILGVEYQAFLSGCDSAATISGASHKVFNYSNDGIQQVQRASVSFLSRVSDVIRVVEFDPVATGRAVATAAIATTQILGKLANRVLPRVPIIAVFGSIFVAFRKIVQPWMDNKRASAEWQRQRDHEANVDKDNFKFGDDFVDPGGAKSYFTQNREKILDSLGGSQSHQQGDFDWYREWEEWARQQWEQGQQQQEANEEKQESNEGKQQSHQKKSKPNYQWDFDVSDPYSILGVKRGATKSEISTAFRREMLKHHPDTKAGASAAEKQRAVERSKLISEAYRKIKSDLKR